MAYQFNELKKQLEEQKKAYEALLELAKQKKEVLIGSDETPLELIVQAEEDILLYIGNIEKRRQQLAKDAASQLNMPLEALTLATWPGLTSRDKADIEVFQQTFLELMGDLDQLNQVNGKLLKVQLDYVQEMIKQVTHISESTSYDKSAGAKSRKTQENKLIDAIL